MSDLLWQSNGGTLLDGTGDLAMGNAEDSMKDMIRTRIRAALNGYKLYAIGADLKRELGNANIAERETRIQQKVSSALTRGFLNPTAFSVETLAAGESLQIFVYVFQQLMVTATLDGDGNVEVD